MSEFGVFAIDFAFIEPRHDNMEPPAYSIAENIKLLKNTVGEMTSFLNRIKDLALAPVRLPFALHDVFCQILNKANAGLRKKTLDKIDNMLKDCIAKGEAAKAAVTAALATSTRWSPERIEEIITAALAWGAAEHNREVTEQTINEMSEEKKTAEFSEEQEQELKDLENELKDLKNQCEETFANMTKLNKDCSESARLKNLDIIGAFLQEYLDFKTTVLLLSFAWSFPFERVTAVSGKMGLQLRLVVPGSKNPFSPFGAKDRPQRITVEVCGYIEAAVSKTINILKQCFDIAPSTADLYFQIRGINRRRVFASANFELDQQQKYQKCPGITITLESVLRAYAIAGCHAFEGKGVSCSTFTGLGSDKHSYSLTEEWLKLALIFLGTVSCGFVAYNYAGDNNIDKLMAGIGSMMCSSHLLTTILPARNRTDMSVITSAPGIKAGVIDHQGTKLETTVSLRGINKIIPKFT